MKYRVSIKRQFSSAFTLTEVAIVLAILGLVIGAIWAAAAMLKANNQVQTANREMASIVQNVRALYADQGALSGGASTLTPALDRLRIFPINMRQNGAVPTGVVFNPWSQITQSVGSPAVILGSVLIYASTATGTTTSSSSSYFNIEFDDLTPAACANLVLSSEQAGMEPQYVQINGVAVADATGVNAPTLPIAGSAVSARCVLAANNIEWTFALKGNSNYE